MTIRPISSADAPVVTAWLRDHLSRHLAWWGASFGLDPDEPLELLIERDWVELTEAAGDADQFVRVQTDEAGPVGVVHAELRRDRYFPMHIVGSLGWVYVDARARGTGVGDQLIASAHAWMDSHHVRGREVFVTGANEIAIRLYERHGYSVVDHRMLARGGLGTAG